MAENMDILGDEIVMDENPNTRRFKTVIHLSLFYGVRVMAAYMLATGLWYFVVAANGLSRYSEVAETGKNLVFISIFVILFLSGDPDV